MKKKSNLNMKKKLIESQEYQKQDNLKIKL